MGNRTARFISTLVASIVAGAPLAAVSQTAPSGPSTADAVGDCLASPKGTAPQGQHWHYRLERSTKRQCWYLRAEGGKAAQSAQAATDAPAADSTAPQPHPMQDARAEYVAPQGVAAPSDSAQAASTAPATAPPSPSAGESNAQQPAVVAPWPDAPAMAAPPAAQPSPPAAQPPAPPATAAAQPSAKPAKSSAPVTLAAADVPADRPTGSLQMLLLVVGGALALAGVLASVIYRFAGFRVRVPAGDRRVNWDNRAPQHRDDTRAPWLNAAPARAPRAERPHPVDFDAARPHGLRLAAFSNESARTAAQAPSTHVEAAEPDETEIKFFDREFEIEVSASQLATNDTHDEEPADRNKNARNGDRVPVDIEIITAMLERLAMEGPQLSRSAISQADYADHARSLQVRPGVRA